MTRRHHRHMTALVTTALQFRLTLLVAVALAAELALWRLVG